MNTRIAFFLFLSATSPIYAGEKSERPSKVTIVDVRSERRNYGIGIGNVRILFKDGHSEIVTSRGNCMIPHVSAKGTAGWTRFAVRNPYQEPVNSELRIRLPNGQCRDFKCFSQGPFIYDWGFADADSAVVIQSEGRHGHFYYIKYDIRSQNVLGTVELATPYDALPEWAKPFADSRPNGFL